VAASDELTETGATELFIGLVSPLGVQLEKLIACLENVLAEASYECVVIKLTDELRSLDDFSGIPDAPLVVRYRQLMDAGDTLRQQTGYHEAMALLGVARVSQLRGNNPPRRRAYIFRSLKHPGEVVTLRQIYGDSFVLIGAYLPWQTRQDRVSRLLEESSAEKSTADAQALVDRDENGGKKWGQRVGDTFCKSDFFVNLAINDMSLQSEIRRFIELLFGHPYHTPTRQEYGMFHAYGASLRSASLGRQVGSSIATQDGQVLALGTNEVPKAGGGLYWPGDEPDERDFQRGHETNDSQKHLVFSDILNRLKGSGWLNAEKSGLELSELIKSATDEKVTEGAYYLDIIEYLRCVHAEMAAIVDAARMGLSVQGAVMYVTTFPCHECTRHIIAAGISKVIFIEPYPKSQARQLHGDAIGLEPGSDHKCQFIPFLGVAPTMYEKLFKIGSDRKKDGKVVNWSIRSKKPRRSCATVAYIAAEDASLVGLKSGLDVMKSKQTSEGAQDEPTLA